MMKIYMCVQENTPRIGCIISNPEQCTSVSIDMMTSVWFQGFRDFGREKVNQFMKANCCGHSLNLSLSLSGAAVAQWRIQDPKMGWANFYVQ